MKIKLRDIKVYLYSQDFYHKLKSFLLSKISFFLRNYYKIFKVSKKNEGLDFLKEKGYFYAAFGENFYKECINSVRLLKRTTNIPIHLITDQKEISIEERSLFHSLSYMPNLHVRSKVDYISLSPFNKTIYLDTDIIVVKNIDELFNLLDNYDVLATLDTARKRENIAKEIEEYRKIPYCFGEVNGGLLCFNKFAKENILKNWPKLFYKYIKETNGWDQPSLRILLWKYRASLYILPPEFNIRSKKLLEKVRENKSIFGKDHMSPRIYHMHINSEIYKNKKHKPLDIDKIIKQAEEKAYEINY
tara:strand:- start:3884 stop:4792 length:909 start_codon:yes stop_codon:yes gene_type:complete